MINYAIESEGLTKRFGKLLAVDRLDLKVPWGSIYGFLGRNGAGKTTTITMLLGLLRMTAGKAEVLGYSCRREALKIRAEVGYVPEQQKMYDWMTVKEIMWFTSRFYPTWNDDLVQKLLRQFHLEPNKKIKQLSRGMVASVALILALGHEPKLLILDDPTSGLDPIVRREFLENIVQLVQEQRRTVFFSSHILSDIERISDWVGILKKGQLGIQSKVDDLKTSTKRIVARFATEPPHKLEMEELLNLQKDGTTLSITVSKYSEKITEYLKTLGVEKLQVQDLSLEDIFVEYLGQEEV